jgi:hypothetical protein
VDAKAVFLLWGSGPSELAETDIIQIVSLLASSMAISPLLVVSRRETADEDVEAVEGLLLLVIHSLSIVWDPC